MAGARAMHCGEGDGVMFIGHFGVAFGAKAAAPKVSLGALFIAAQFLDLLWPTLLLLGVERVRIAPGATAFTPLLFEDYPVSHSLLAVLGWAVLVALAFFALRREVRGAIVIGLLVASHWVLDLIVHQPDLPIVPGGTLVGLGLWHSVPLTLAIEVPLFALGVWLYARATIAQDSVGRWSLVALVALLLLIYLGNVFGSPPPSVQAIAWVGQAQWLLVLWAFWVDRHRTARQPIAAAVQIDPAPAP
jgi:hypothetical protein